LNLQRTGSQSGDALLHVCWVAIAVLKSVAIEKAGERDLAAQLDDELEKGFADFEAGRFKRFDSVDDLRSEVESRVKARAVLT
jgi:hypothetical protein